MLISKKDNPVVTKLFIRGRKLKSSHVFITQSYFAIPNNIGPTSRHYFIMRVPNKRELQQIAFNYPSNIDFKDFINLYKSTEKPSSFLEFKSELNEILKGNLNYKSKYQVSTIKNIKKLYNGLEKVRNFLNGCTGMVSDAKYK